MFKMTFSAYTHLGLENAADEPSRTRECAPVTQKIIWKKHIGALLKQSIFWCKGKRIVIKWQKDIIQ
jgi:hypothetical protein